MVFRYIANIYLSTLELAIVLRPSNVRFGYRAVHLAIDRIFHFGGHFFRLSRDVD